MLPHQCPTHCPPPGIKWSPSHFHYLLISSEALADCHRCSGKVFNNQQTTRAACKWNLTEWCIWWSNFRVNERVASIKWQTWGTSLFTTERNQAVLRNCWTSPGGFCAQTRPHAPDFASQDRKQSAGACLCGQRLLITRQLCSPAIHSGLSLKPPIFICFLLFGTRPNHWASLKANRL